MAFRSGWLVVQIFCNGLEYPTKITTYSVVVGAFMEKSMKKAHELLEELPSNNYQWVTYRGNPKTKQVSIELMI